MYRPEKPDIPRELKLSKPQGAGMAVTLISQELPTRINQFINASEPCTIEEFCREEEAEVLDFLGERPLHTVFIAGLIRDNGLVSPDNRGSFYACRSRGGDLEGV